MARVPKTTGQGISRKIYKQGWERQNKARGPQLKTEKAVEGPRIRGPGGSTGSRREYPKDQGVKPFTVDYGDTLPISSLDDVKRFGK